MTLHHAIIIQTVVGLLGVVPSYMIGMGSVMSAAAADKNPRLGASLLMIGLALPFVLVISLVAMWIAHLFAWDGTATAFLILPWAHLTLLIGGMLLLFKLQS